MKPDEYQPLIDQFESAVEKLRAPKEHDLTAYLDYETTKKKIQSFQKNAADQLIQKLMTPLEESGASLFLQSIIKEGSPYYFEAIVEQNFEILNEKADKTIIKGNNLANARFTKALKDIATDKNFLDFYTFLQALPAAYFTSINDLAIAIPEPKTNPAVTSTKSATLEIRGNPEATSEMSPEKKELWVKAIHNRGSADPHPYTKKVAKIFKERRKASSEVTPPKELSTAEIKTESKQTVEEQLDSLKRLLTENIIITPLKKIEERPTFSQLNVIIFGIIKAPTWPALFLKWLSDHSKDSTIDDIVNLALQAASADTTENKKEVKPEAIKQVIVNFFEGSAIRPHFTNFSLTSEDSRAALKTINEVLKSHSKLDESHEAILSDLLRSIKIDSDTLTKLTKELEKKKDTGKLLLLIQNHNIPPNNRIQIIYPNLIKNKKDKKTQDIIINVLLDDLEIDLKKMQTRVLADLDKIKDFLSPEENKLIEDVKKEGRKISGDIAYRSDREKKEFIQKMESGFQKSNEFPQTYAAQALISEERFTYVFKSKERRATDQRNLGRVLQETYETRKSFSDFMGKLVKHFYDENWQLKPNLKQDGTALTKLQKDTLEKFLPPYIVLTKDLLGERNEDITKALNHAIDRMGDGQFREALKEAAANYNAFNKFVTEAKLAVKGDFAGLQLPDLIIMPIQQGPRLPLLMHETMKNSDPANALYSKAKEGLGVAQKLAAEINQNVDKQIDKKPKQIDEKQLRNKLFMSIDITSTKLKESILYQLVKNPLDKLITTIAKEFNKLDLATLYNFRHFYTILSQQTSPARALKYIESYDLKVLNNGPLQNAIAALKTELGTAKEKELIMPTTTHPKEIAPETAGLGTPTIDASTTTKTVTESKPVTIEPKSSPKATPPTISQEEFDKLSRISARLEPMDEEAKAGIKSVTIEPTSSPKATPPTISQEEFDKLSRISARLEPMDEEAKAGIKSSPRQQSVEIKHPFIMLPLPLPKNPQEQRMNDFVQFLQGAYMKFENKKIHPQSFTTTHKSTLIGNSLFHHDLHAPAGTPSNTIKTPGKVR